MLLMRLCLETQKESTMEKKEYKQNEKPVTSKPGWLQNFHIWKCLDFSWCSLKEFKWIQQNNSSGCTFCRYLHCMHSKVFHSLIDNLTLSYAVAWTWLLYSILHWNVYAVLFRKKKLLFSAFSNSFFLLLFVWFVSHFFLFENVSWFALSWAIAFIIYDPNLIWTIFFFF